MLSGKKNPDFSGSVTLLLFKLLKNFGQTLDKCQLLHFVNSIAHRAAK